MSPVYPELPDHDKRNLCKVQAETALKPAATYVRITTLVFKESKTSCSIVSPVYGKNKNRDMTGA